VLPVVWTTSYLPVIGQAKTIGHILKMTRQRQHRFDTASCWCMLTGGSVLSIIALLKCIEYVSMPIIRPNRSTN